MNEEQTKDSTSAACGASDVERGVRGIFTAEPTREQLADACMWNRHDFGLMDDEAKENMMATMRNHWRAIWKACNTPGRGKEYMPSNVKYTPQ